MRYIVAAPLWFGADAPAPAQIPGGGGSSDGNAGALVSVEPGPLDHPEAASVTVQPGNAVEVQRNEDGSYTLRIRRPLEAYAAGAALGVAGVLLFNALRGKR